jgi:hypothetical protein
VSKKSSTRRNSTESTKQLSHATSRERKVLLSPKINPLQDTEKTMEASISRNQITIGTIPTEEESLDTVPNELRSIPEFRPAFASKIEFLRIGNQKQDIGESQPAPDTKLLTILDS